MTGDPRLSILDEAWIDGMRKPVTVNDRAGEQAFGADVWDAIDNPQHRNRKQRRAADKYLPRAEKKRRRLSKTKAKTHRSAR